MLSGSGDDGCRTISSCEHLRLDVVPGERNDAQLLSDSVCAASGPPLTLPLVAGGQPCPQGRDVHVGLARTSSPTLSNPPLSDTA